MNESINNISEAIITPVTGGSALSDFIIERLTSAWSQTAILAPKIFWALIALVIFFFLARWTRRITNHLMKKSPWDNTLNTLTAATAGFIVFLMGIIVSLSILDLDKAVLSLLAGAGLAGVALAFAFKDSATNLLAGIILASRRPFKVGHLVKIANYEGRVRSVGLRATLLRLPTGEAVEIPNQMVIENPLMNYTTYGERRVDFEVGVSYAENLEFVKRISLATIQRIKAVKEVEIYFTNFDDSSITFVARCWINFKSSQKDYYAARDQIIIQLKKAFDREGITIPFPIRTLDFSAKGGEPLRTVLKK